MCVRFFALTVFAALVLACSGGGSSAPEPCDQNPWECPTGQTCWPATSSTYACLNSGPGTAGSACEASEGAPTCGDGLVCVQKTAAGGTCAPYCSQSETAHACPSGQICTMVLLAGSVVQVCADATSPADAGGTGSAATEGGSGSLADGGGAGA